MNLQANLLERLSFPSVIVSGSIFAPHHASRPPVPRKRLSLDHNWRFSSEMPGLTQLFPLPGFAVVSGDYLSPLEDDASVTPGRDHGMQTLGDAPPWTQTRFDDSGWSSLNLAESPGTGWLRRSLSIGIGDAGKQVGLEMNEGFEHARVWINGRYLGAAGSRGLRRDLTPYLLIGGPNTVVLHVEPSAHCATRRSAWLVTTGALHVEPWGVCVSLQTLGEHAISLAIGTMLNNRHPQGRRGTLACTLLDATGLILGEQSTAFHIFGDDRRSCEQRISIPGLDSLAPQTLRIETSLIVEGRVVDRDETHFNLRSVLAQGLAALP